MDDEVSRFSGILGVPEVLGGFNEKGSSADEGGFEGLNGKCHGGLRRKWKIAFDTSLSETL